MGDTLPGVQLWEPALNMLSSMDTDKGQFPAVPDRSTVLDKPWLTDHHFTGVTGGDHEVYTYGWGLWQAYADYDPDQIDPNTSSSAWQQFYQHAFTILSGTPRLPLQTDTAQWDSFDGPTGLSAPVRGVQNWLLNHVKDIQGMRDSVATDESTIQGQAADVIWQILDHFQNGMTSVADQLARGLTYLTEAAEALHAYHQACVDTWNKWLAGASGQTFDTTLPGYSLPDSPQLVSPLGCLNAVARAIKFDQNMHHWNRGLYISVPDNFTSTNDLASWSFWQDIERGARAVWTAKLQQLDDPAIKTAFDNLVAKYRMGTSALQLTAPTFGRIDPGTADNPDKNNADSTNNSDLSSLLDGLANTKNGGVAPPPDSGNGTGVGGAPTGVPAGGATGPSHSTVPPFAPTPPPATTNGRGAGTDGYLVPDGKGGYDFKPSSDFAGGVVPAGAIPGSITTGAGGRRTFQPSTVAESTTKPENGTAGYLVPDGKGGYEFKPASMFKSPSDVPPGSVAGYQVSDGQGKSHFVPSATDDIHGDRIPTLTEPSTHQPPAFDYRPPPTVSSERVGARPAELSAVDSNGGYLTPPPPLPGPSTTESAPVDLAAVPATADTGKGGAIGAGPGAAAGGENNVPLYPPTAGGMGGMGGTGQQTQDRQRTTWLSEDERVWGTDPDVSPAVLGRNNRKRSGEEEEFEYAPFGGQRPGTTAGRPSRPAGQDRRRQTGTGSTTGV